MDFEEDRFADDEEHADLFNDEQDEDTKAAEQRIKEDQLKANVFDLKEEKDYEDEEEREKKEREARRTFGKKVRKALKKRERNFDYSSGSDVNPYTDEEVRILFSIELSSIQKTNVMACRVLMTARSNVKRRKKNARPKRKGFRERRIRRHLPRAVIRPRVVQSTPMLSRSQPDLASAWGLQFRTRVAPTPLERRLKTGISPPRGQCPHLQHRYVTRWRTLIELKKHMLINFSRPVRNAFETSHSAALDLAATSMSVLDLEAS
jgi:hypothetical protein